MLVSGPQSVRQIKRKGYVAYSLRRRKQLFSYNRNAKFTLTSVQFTFSSDKNIKVTRESALRLNGLDDSGLNWSGTLIEAILLLLEAF